MSAQNILPQKIVEGGISGGSRESHHNKDANLIALGFILLLVSVVVMSSVLIYMCLSGSAGESMLFIGIFPFTIMFILLLLSK
jgi:hypothetical protein